MSHFRLRQCTSCFAYGQKIASNWIKLDHIGSNWHYLKINQNITIFSLLTFHKQYSCLNFHVVSDWFFSLVNRSCLYLTVFFQTDFLGHLWNFHMFEISPNIECMPKIRSLRTCEHAQFQQGFVIIKCVILMHFQYKHSLFI